MQCHCSVLTLCLLFVMSSTIAGEFEDKLKGVGISQEAIDILTNQDYNEIDSLQKLTVDNLVQMGIKRGTADKIFANFGKKEPQPIDKMPLSDILSYLLSNPHDANALSLLKQQNVIQEALAKTQNWAVVDPKDKKLDVQSTMAYLEFLKGSAPKTTFRDKAVVSIEVALGQVEDVTREHPLLDEKLGPDGIDSNGLNWLQVPVDVRKALFWAKVMTPQHHLFPASPEQAVFDLYKEASKKPLETGVVQKIVVEYQSALLQKDSLARDVQLLKMPE